MPCQATIIPAAQASTSWEFQDEQPPYDWLREQLEGRALACINYRLNNQLALVWYAKEARSVFNEPANRPARTMFGELPGQPEGSLFGTVILVQPIVHRARELIIERR